MRKREMRLGLLGALTGAVLLAGCDSEYATGRFWSLSGQEDYYPDEAQEEVGRAYSNLDSTSGLFETTEQDKGTGGAGDAKAYERDNIQRIQGGEQAQEHLWLKQDLRVPYPPPPLDSIAAIHLGTGRALQTGPNGAWVQGIYAVEAGSRGEMISSPYEPREIANDDVRPPQDPVSDKPGSQ